MSLGEQSSRCGFIILLLLLFREQTIHNIVCAELCRVLVVILELSIILGRIYPKGGCDWNRLTCVVGRVRLVKHCLSGCIGDWIE